ncbi:hypothetical protein INR49_012900 [Caranx melampygus]|nr:hypothetical protein INR49_012900 [Caranx melampygus]
MAIVTQIKAMGSYKLGPVSELLIQANHTSSVGQIESVNFTMSGISMGMGCHIQGSSMSAFWDTLFDNGTNYCNLHNVVEVAVVEAAIQKAGEAKRSGKCLIIKMSPTSLEVNHTSPWTGSVTKITFNLYPPAAPLFCKYVALRALPPELENSVEEDHHAQRQDTGDGDGHRFLRAPCTVQFDDNVHITVVVVALLRHRGAPVPVGVCRKAVATHEVPQDGPWVARLHTEKLVVKLPVLLSLVKVDGINFGRQASPEGVDLHWVARDY